MKPHEVMAQVHVSARVVAFVIFAGLQASCMTVGGDAPNDDIAGRDATLAAEERKAECMTAAGWDNYESVGPPGEDPIWQDLDFVDDVMRCNEVSGLTALAATEGHDRLVREELGNIDERNREIAAFVDCLREQGWDVPDPEPHPDMPEALSMPPPPPDLAQQDEAAYGEDLLRCNEASFSSGRSAVEGAP